MTLLSRFLILGRRCTRSRVCCTLWSVQRTLSSPEVRENQLKLGKADMASPSKPAAKPRPRLSRGRVLEVAIGQADSRGLEAVSMRTLAEELGVAPMALYRHIAGKEDLIDAMVDIVFGEVGVPPGGGDWKAAMRQRAI